ncbi:MAG: helix-turn-helix transcriptional regulator [Spirochaetia bacterium]|jgi:transcriptional regulator with XRE-family HTH domain
MKTTDFDKYLDTQLKNPGFRKAYEDLEEEYELAKQIIRFRIDRNLSQTQLAKLVGTSQPAIARLESGNHTNLTLGFLSRLAKALDLRAELKFLPLKPTQMASAGVRRKGSRTSASARAV